MLLSNFEKDKLSLGYIIRIDYIIRVLKDTRNM